MAYLERRLRLNNVISLWPTNLLVEMRPDGISDTFLSEMIAIGDEYEAMHPEAHVPHYMRKSKEVAYNLLSDERPPCQIFKSILKSRMIQLAKAEGFIEPEKVLFEAITSLRRFSSGEYAKPHNHRSVDYVAVLWLSLEVTDFDNNNTHQKPAGNRLHIIDPIAARSRLLNHNMLFPVSPRAGMLVIHPASTFHTSEINLGSEDTIALVTNIKIVESVRNYVTL
jgi:hypothetical protein